MTSSVEELTQLKQDGLVLLQNRQFTQARSHYSRACEKFDQDPELLFHLGVANAELGGYSEAAALFQRVVLLMPDSALAHTNLGRAFEALGRVRDAIECYQTAVRLAPDNVSVLHRLAYAFRLAGDNAYAVPVYQTLTKLSAGDPSVWFSLGDILFDLGLLEDAELSYREALRLQPRDSDVRVKLGHVLIQLGKLDEGESCFRDALKRSANHAGAIAGLADIARFRGDYEKAAALLQKPIETGSVDVSILVSYASVAPVVGETEAAIELINNNLSTYGEGRQRSLHFALGELYDKQGLFDSAFSNYQQGNRLKKAKFDAHILQQEVDNLIGFFDKTTIASLACNSVKTDKPVFVVGMLRSGSTLVEQILASHPYIAGAGELNEISNLVTGLKNRFGFREYPACLTQLDSNERTSLAGQYLAHIDTIDPKALRVIDKGLINYQHLGLIEILFPGAIVIHCTRHPLDTCLSCYFHDFVGTHHYSYDLKTLGRFYRQYQRLMQHWSSTLSLPIMHVSYEVLVAEPESQSRAIVKFCGLDWDEQCSHFYSSRRSVVTSSATQVRQPIYNSSVNRYRNYEKYLDPLKGALYGQSSG